MAWTTPSTVVAGQTLSAAFWNEQVRDNSAYLKAEADAVGLVLIETQSFTASSAITFDDVFSSTYDNYRVVGACTGSTSSDLDGKFRTSGSDNSDNSYYQQFLVMSNTSVSAARTGPTTTGRFSYVESTGGWFSFDLFNPNRSDRTAWHGTVQRYAANWDITIRGGVFSGSVIFDGIKFTPASGTITGKISIYGYRI